ncbi:MAG TPA: hypothetical protein VH796_15375 [Nitrososphaeraceae archaeon]|jgi:hypothetical protein
MISHLVTRKQSQIAGNTSIHTRASSEATIDLIGHDDETTSEVCHVLQYFLLCRSCLWCASYIHSKSTRTNVDLADKFGSCPLCLSGSLDLMPLTPHEDYIFNYSKKAGVTLEFKR